MPDRSPSALLEDRADDIQRAAADLRRGERVKDVFVRMAELAGFDPEQVRAGLASDFEARGTLDARVVVRVLEARTVAALLPRGLQLAPQPLVPRGRHPVCLLFSDDFFEAWFGDMQYREMMVAIPFVQRTDEHIPHRGPFIYMPRLYLDQRRPRVLGNLLYGFEKLDGDIETADDRYVVRVPGGPELARLSWTPKGEWSEPSQLPNFEIVRQLFEMPTIAQGKRIADPDAWEHRGAEGFFIGANVRYLFDEPDTRVQPIEAEVRIGPELTPRGLRTDPHASPSLADAPLGAFRVRVQQRVSMPASCSEVEYAPPTPRNKQRVVVLGGGPAACAAAFYLAKQRDRYDVEIYTQGWRLGGKCAAARSASVAERIEEHGLHAFLGFYENAFRTVREVYEVAGLPLAVGDEPYAHADGEGPLAAAFSGKLDVGLLDRHDGRWQFFRTGQKFNGGIPGTIPQSELDELPGAGQILLAVFERIRADVRGLDDQDGSSRALVSRTGSRESTWWRRLFAWLRGLVGLPVEDDGSALGRSLDRITDFLQEATVEQLGDWIVARHASVTALSAVLSGLRALLGRLYADRIRTDAEIWFRWSNLDLSLTIAIGILEAGTTDFSDLDDIDFRRWLLDNGLDPRNADTAAVTMVYNTLFANGVAEPVAPDDLACGVALRWFLLVGFGYKAYPAYDFRLSCPQTLMTPLYRALTALGVRIHFFHEVVGLDVEGSDADARRLTGIRLRRQARVRAGSDAYAPLAPAVTRRDPEVALADWPPQPDWSQLEPADAEAIRDGGIDLEDAWSGWAGVEDRALRQGDDFDLCVLGIPLGALREVARPLYDPASPTADPAWTTMMQSVGVVETASFQLWFDRDREALISGPRDLLTGYEHPWPSFGDFSHLVPWEGWPRDRTPKFLAYHTGAFAPGHPLDAHPVDDHGFPARRRAEVVADIKAWLRQHWRGLYDRVDSWDQFLAALSAPPGVQGEARLDAQYFHTAFQPSNLYVLSRAGTTKHRLGASESGYRHLFLCGDWTRTDLACGCVEAAIQSGMLASRVISRYPRYVWRTSF